MTVTRRLLALLTVVTLAFACTQAGARDAREPVLVLVSLDGWRWDYLDRADAPNLRALAARGVTAEGLVPPFPTKTFPSHYTIVTGLHPVNHGVVANVMVDPDIPDRFALSSPAVTDGRWWDGEPIWVTAVRQGRRAASMFWPGSEAPIGGVRPTHWRPYDGSVSRADRVAQVLEWLALPSGERPSFVTLYFSDIDTVAHHYGPEAAEVFAAAAQLDGAVGDLVAGIEALGLTDLTTIVVVSDHGLSEISPDRTIVLDDYVDPAELSIVELSPVLAAAPRRGSAADLVARLNGRHPALRVYVREDVPAHLRYRDHPRIAPVIGLADEGWTITTRARLANPPARPLRGMHGYDPRHRSMHGVFIAAGPRVRQGLVVPAFENVHLYAFMCAILGLVPAPHDGDPAVTRGLLRD